MIAGWGIPGGGKPGWCGNMPGGLNRDNAELDNDVGYGPRNPAEIGYPGGLLLQHKQHHNFPLKFFVSFLLFFFLDGFVNICRDSMDAQHLHHLHLIFNLQYKNYFEISITKHELLTLID